MSVMTMTGAIGGISAPLSGAARAAGAATVFYTILDAHKPNTSGLKNVHATEDIILEHVNFSYPTRPGQKVLDDVSLTFPAGKLTAIVGPSGKWDTLTIIKWALLHWRPGVSDSKQDPANPQLSAFFSGGTNLTAMIRS